MTYERSSDKLARYIMYAAALAIICTVCWYLRSVLVYVILAAVVSLIGRPLMKVFSKVKIKGKGLPTWLCAILSLLVIVLGFLCIITEVVPIVYRIVSDISGNMQILSRSGGGLAAALDSINAWLAEKSPELEPGYRIENSIASLIRQAFSFSSAAALVGSVASAIGSIGIGIFSTVFISFFFLKDERLFRKIVEALVPDALEARAEAAISDIEVLLSRYFVGLITEVLIVAMIDFLGLWIFARTGLSAAIGIAFMAGILNVVPYVGPFVGTVLGSILAIVLKVSSTAAAGGSINIWSALLVILAVFIVAQLVDNFVLQPLIYSRSIKSSPLEIFIVLLVAGTLGGVLGMLVAIPAYTVFRVVASEFFGNVKAIKRLTGSQS